MGRISVKAQAEITFLRLEKKALSLLKRFFHRIDSDRVIHRFCRRHFQSIADIYRDKPFLEREQTAESECAAIWVFWWQGYDGAPPLVRRCIDSIRLHAGGHPVVLLTRENCQTYAALPEYIFEKVRSGRISLTHFSDILRMSLLAAHGGLWLDATIFVSQNIPEAYFQMPLFTVRYPTSPSTITKGRWTIFSMAAKPGSILFQYCLGVSLAYWKAYSKPVDYFFTDYVIAQAYEQIPSVREAIDSIPENNTGIKLLDRLFFRPYRADEYEQVLRDSVFHKLNRKRAYPEKDGNGMTTHYGHFMRGEESDPDSAAERPLVSVVIPTYNRADTILRSVESVLGQSYRNIELIVVDDCSADGTEAVIAGVNDKRIRFIQLDKNSGACAARNRGIDEAKGGVIAFNDSDDVWHADKLEKQLAFMQRTRADVVVSSMAVFDEEKGAFLFHFPDTAKTREGPVTYEDLLRYNSTSTQLLFARAECLKETKFDPSMPRFQDWEVSLRLAKKYRLFHQDEILVDTFIQKDSITKNPARGIAGMDMLYQKHRAAIDSDPGIQAAFFLKKAGSVWRAGKSPVEELRIVYRCEPSAKNLLKLILAKLRLYGIAGKLLGK